MRIIFSNLHCNVFYLRPFEFIIKGRSYPTYKHLYFLQYLLKNNKKVAVYINNKGTTATGILKNLTKSSYGRRLEFYLVMIFNGINPFKIKVIDDYNKINKDDVLIGNYYYSDNLIDLDKIECYKILMCNHYVYLNSNTNLNKYKINCLINEIDISKDIYFNKFFRYDGAEFYTLPYVFQKRYKINKKFKGRKNKAIAVGTLSYCNRKEFIEFYKTNDLQPMRREIMNNKYSLSKYIDSYISYIIENNTKKIDHNDNLLFKYYKKIYNYFHSDRQIKYFSFNMAEKFNEYKMFICPEEITGIPGIGFVEGMACGCAYIGVESEAYSQLGLISGYHYIGYNGTLDDLKKKILYYQNHKNDLNRIAKNGYQYVVKNFNSKKVAEQFYIDLIKKVKKYNDNF